MQHTKGIHVIVVAITMLAVSNSTRAQAQEEGKFRASVVSIDITPDESMVLHGYSPRDSEGVHDRIYHRIVAMDDGETQFVLVSSDLCLISPGYYDAFTEKLEEETGIGPEQVWWTVTHTHSAPEVGPPGLYAVMLTDRALEPSARFDEYTDHVERLLIDGIKQARSQLAPARLGIGTGRAMANINRRAIDVDGSASLGLNPEGPVDRQIGLIRLDRSDGSPLALIANYAMHGTALGSQNRLISGDAPGIVAAYVEQHVGAPMLYINGAAGDIAPIYSVYPDFRRAHITQFNVLLGDRILAANRSLRHTTSGVRLRLGEAVIETPRKEGFGWVEELADYARTTSTGDTLVRVPVDFLEINEEVLLWSAPLELFNEIATEVRRRSPYAYTFYYGYSNGWLGYLPTREAFSQGGYETGRVTPFTPQVEEDFRDGVITYIHALHGIPPVGRYRKTSTSSN